MNRRTPRFVSLSDQDGRRPVEAQPIRYGWRLDAANHRPLARSVGLWRSEHACRLGADEVHRHADHLDTGWRSATGESEWRWFARLAGLEVAVSVHAYPRRVECARALTQFLAALAEADPAAGVVRHYGPQALRGYHPHRPAAGSALEQGVS